MVCRQLHRMVCSKADVFVSSGDRAIYSWFLAVSRETGVVLACLLKRTLPAGA